MATVVALVPEADNAYALRRSDGPYPDGVASGVTEGWLSPAGSVTSRRLIAMQAAYFRAGAAQTRAVLCCWPLFVAGVADAEGATATAVVNTVAAAMRTV